MSLKHSDTPYAPVEETLFRYQRQGKSEILPFAILDSLGIKHHFPRQTLLVTVFYMQPCYGLTPKYQGRELQKTLQQEAGSSQKL